VQSFTQEQIAQQLVEMSLSQCRSILQILFVNPRLLPRFTVLPGKQVLGLVELTGCLEKAREIISLKKSIFSLRAIPSISRDLNGVSDFIRQVLTQLDSIHPETLQELIPRLVTSQLSEPIPLIETATLEGVIAFLFENFANIYDKQSMGLKDTSVTIKYLHNLGLIKPWLQASICPHCFGLELVVGSHPLNNSPCSKCNLPRIHARIYLFEDQFSQMKMKEEDLPLFISKYLQVRSAGSINSTPFKWFNADTEIDVYVPKNCCGVECKTFLRSLTFGNDDLQQKTSKLVGKIGRYCEVGLKNIIVVSSLNEADSAHLEQNLVKRLKKTDISFESLTVVPGTIDSLLNALDNRILKVGK